MDMNTRIPCSWGKRVRKNTANPYGWKKLSSPLCGSNLPVFYCFGGNATISDRFANAIAKRTQLFLGITPRDQFVNIYSMKYGYEELSQEKEFLSNEDFSGNVTMQEIEQNAYDLFVTRLIDEKGKRLSVKESAKNMRNISIFSHCFGANVFNHIIDRTAEIMMDELKFTQKQTLFILSQIMNISYAPNVKQNAWTTNFELKSFHDQLLDYKAQFPNLNKSYLGCGKLIRKDNTLTLLANSFIAEDSEEDEHLSEFLDRDKQWGVKGNRQNVASECIACVMAMSVINAKLNKESKSFIPLADLDTIQDVTQNIINNGNNTAVEKEQFNIWLRQNLERRDESFQEKC